jgi:hypothetical protein
MHVFDVRNGFGQYARRQASGCSYLLRPQSRPQDFQAAPENQYDSQARTTDAPSAHNGPVG